MNNNKPAKKLVDEIVSDVKATHAELNSIKNFEKNKEAEIKARTQTDLKNIDTLKTDAENALKSGDIEKYRQIIEEIAK